ncbi:heavy-metal-associated domain-containing protein [Agromyces protaetiae]|nr:heavy metal-associated domain-containing protein [Agromyces protaetiae]
MTQSISIGPAPTKLLPLADASARGGDAEASCACCAPVVSATEQGAAEASAARDLVVAEYAVVGMTCGNCVKHVTADVSGVTGVERVEVDLVAGGVSTVRVLSALHVDPALVAEAVEEAGYEVVAG